MSGYHGALIALLVLGAFTLMGTLGNIGAYGRLQKPGARAWTLPARPAWLLFEAPQLFAFGLSFWLTAATHSVVAVLLFVLWQTHYLYRGLIYPLRRRDQGKRFPLLAVLFGFIFNLLNGYANGHAVAHAEHLMDTAWLTTPWFIGGLLLALSGWYINFQADNILIKLRQDGGTGYKIPYGGAFRYVSAANYFGEILLWSGWALMSMTAAGWVFVLFTLANLLPRAWHSHRWYRAQFADYPPERKAVLPFIL